MTADDKNQAGQATPELFRGLSDEEIRSCMRLGQWQTREQGSFFFREGESPSGLHLLGDGRVKVYQSTASGRQAWLRIVSAGDVFGLQTLDPAPRPSATAQALEESRALVWDRSTWVRMIETNQRLAINVLGMAVRQLVELQETYVHLATQHAERRVAWALALLMRKLGQKKEDGSVVLENLSERELADLAGTTIYTVSRILRGWERSNALTKGRGRIVVQEPERLAELAEDLW